MFRNSSLSTKVDSFEKDNRQRYVDIAKKQMAQTNLEQSQYEQKNFRSIDDADDQTYDHQDEEQDANLSKIRVSLL